MKDKREKFVIQNQKSVNKGTHESLERDTRVIPVKIIFTGLLGERKGENLFLNEDIHQIRENLNKFHKNK